MKKSLVALAALAATSVFAQSSVTLSGQVQYGVKKDAAGNTTYGGSKGDRNYLQFNATEDLGGGLKAGAFLQHRFNPEDGQQSSSYTNTSSGTTTAKSATNANQMWEQSGLQLDSSSLGQVRVGRFSTQLVTTNGAGHYLEDWAAGTHSGLNYGRSSGQMQYTSPKFGGAEIFLLTVSGAANKNTATSGGGYINSQAMYRNNNATAMGVNYTQGGLKAQLTTVSGHDNERITIINADYDFGPFRVAVNQLNLKDDIAKQGANTNYMVAHKTTEYGIKAPIGANITVALAKHVNDKDATNVAGTKRSATGFRGTYNFSKRTWVEVFVSKSDQNFDADTYGTKTASDGRAYFAGLTHSF